LEDFEKVGFANRKFSFYNAKNVEEIVLLMEKSAHELAIKLNDHTLISDKNLLTAFRFGVSTWTEESRSLLHKVYNKDMNYPTLKQDYLAEEKDSKFFSKVGRGDIVTSVQVAPSAGIPNKGSRQVQYIEIFDNATNCIF
jgi:hypothetical protein